MTIMRYNIVMPTFLLILTIVLFILLVIVAAMRPIHSQLSLFELQRRADNEDVSAKRALERERLLADIISMQQVITSLLLIIFVLLSVTTFGWLFGILVGLFVALEYGAIARIKFIRKFAQFIYAKIDGTLIKFVKKAPVIFKLLRSVSAGDCQVEQKIDSREELQYLVSESGNILTDDEKKLIVHSLSFNSQTVESIMTPRSMIDSIKKSEFLGPLTLDELHKTGHSKLPVFAGDIDHIVGILNLKNLLALDIKRSTTAEKAMDPKVYYIRADQTLGHALAAFLRTKHHLFVVVNEFRETVGLLALEDVIEALIGHKITDEFDAYDDLRAVALRNPRDNNSPEKSQDV